MNKIKEVLAAIPLDWDKARKILDDKRYTKEELAEIALHVAEGCFCEYADIVDYQGLEQYVPEETHSHYLVDTLKLLLEYGLDPNVIIDESNVMWQTMYIDVPDVGAAALRLLLEHGGDPNLELPHEAGLFTELDFRVIEDGYDYGFRHVVQCWLVAVAYGGKNEDDVLPIRMRSGIKVDLFKDFERYDYVFEWIPGQSGRPYRLDLIIFDKEKREVLARRG